MDQTLSIVIPAKVGLFPGVRILPFTAKVFHVISASGNFRVRKSPGGASSSVGPGKGFGSEEAAPFTRLTLLNDTGMDITAEVWIGDSRYSDPQATAEISNTVTVSGQEEATTTIAYDRVAAPLANNAEIEIPAQNAGKNLRSIIVTNMDAAANLLIRKGATNCGAVFPNTPWTASFVGEAIKVRNESGGDIACYIMAQYYNG